MKELFNVQILKKDDKYFLKITPSMPTAFEEKEVEISKEQAVKLEFRNEQKVKINCMKVADKAYLRICQTPKNGGNVFRCEITFEQYAEIGYSLITKNNGREYYLGYL